MNTVLEDLLIQSPARRNKLFSLLLGSLLCAISLTVLILYPALNSYMIGSCLVGLVLILVGCLKYFEPSNSLLLSAQGLRYFHRYGSWFIAWQDIVIVTHPSFSHGLQRCFVPYIGIKLRDLTTVAANVAPRLASRQIHEQRDLSVLALQQGLVKLASAGLNFEPFKLTPQQIVSGPKAAWLHQMMMLNQAFGCHLYVPVTSFTQQPEQLISILKRYQQRALLLL